MPQSTPPRMLTWALATLALMVLALYVHAAWPGSVVAVTIYKAHLMALGGWGGYWLDRALSPYNRPHQYLEDDDEFAPATFEPQAPGSDEMTVGLLSQTQTGLGSAELRRAIIVAACLICVGLGA